MAVLLYILINANNSGVMHVCFHAVDPVVHIQYIVDSLHQLIDSYRFTVTCTLDSIRELFGLVLKTVWTTHARPLGVARVVSYYGSFL